MLNDADGQGSGYSGGQAREALNEAETLGQNRHNSKGQVNWRREAREHFDLEAGEQLNEDDKAILQDAKRPIVIFICVSKHHCRSHQICASVGKKGIKVA